MDVRLVVTAVSRNVRPRFEHIDRELPMGWMRTGYLGKQPQNSLAQRLAAELSEFADFRHVPRKEVEAALIQPALEVGRDAALDWCSRRLLHLIAASNQARLDSCMVGVRNFNQGRGPQPRCFDFHTCHCTTESPSEYPARIGPEAITRAPSAPAQEPRIPRTDTFEASESLQGRYLFTGRRGVNMSRPVGVPLRADGRAIVGEEMFEPDSTRL